MKRWSAALASISLLVFGIAHADAPRSLELPVNVPVEISLPGLEQAVAADPSIIRADADLQRAVLTLTGVALARQAVVYAWTADGMIVFIGSVVAPPLPPVVERPFTFDGDGAAGGATYRVSVGGGFRRAVDGMHRLPMSFGGGASKALGGDRLTFRGETRPFREDHEREATGSALLQWTGEGRRVAAGAQPVELAPQVLTAFPLRGVTAEQRVGAVTFGAFGGTRATPEFTLMPRDHDPLPATLGGVRATWTASPEVRVSGAFALAERDPLATFAAEWQRGVWAAALETAGTAERLAAGLRLKRETERLTLEQRLAYRTRGVSALMPGSDGVTSETGGVYRVNRDLALNARVSMLPFGAPGGFTGTWHAGADWLPVEGVRVVAGVDRTFDGALTTLGGTIDTRSRFGDASLTVTRTVQASAGAAGPATFWYEAGRFDKPLESKPFTRVFVEETLTHGEQQGNLTVYVGAEVEHGWLRASLAPGIIVPTVTDPNGIAETLRLRVSATPSPALQMQAEVRQTFGAKPDTTVQLGLGVGMGKGAPWGSAVSWLSSSSVEGAVFVDLNGNGQRDPGEPGLPNVRVQLDGGRSVMTDAEGRYEFTGLKEGTYDIAVDRSNLPPTLRLASASPVTVRMPKGARQVSFAFAGTGAIQGVVFNDLVLSGRFSGNEPGIAAEVVLEGPGTRRTLGVNGAFALGGLAPGRYHLRVDPLSLPPAHVIARPDVELEIAAGDVKTAQFPVVALRALQVFTCRGRHAGPCEDDDVPAAGVRVTIGGIAVTTDARGRALVRQLPAGQLPVTVDAATVPRGWAAPKPSTVDLPESPATLPLSIRLTPAR